MSDFPACLSSVCVLALITKDSNISINEWEILAPDHRKVPKFDMKGHQSSKCDQFPGHREK